MNELAILDAIQAMRAPWLDSTIAAYTSLGNIGFVWMMLGVCLILFKRTRRIGIAVLVALAIGAIITNCVLKPLIMRPRPCDVNAAVNMIIPRPGGSSFPSGHTTAAFAAFSAILFARDPKSPGALTIATGMAAALMAFSRLYAYVHYPTDVLAGITVGLMAGFLAARMVSAFAEHRKQQG